jgi:hypothetical protein
MAKGVGRTPTLAAAGRFGVAGAVRARIAAIGLSLSLWHCSSPVASPGQLGPNVSSDGGEESGNGTEADSGGDAPAPPPPAESGFIDVPAQATSFVSPARIFYSFQPTQSTDRARKPLLVFFNGGPGTATSTLLLSYGTGPYTLSRRGELGDAPQINERTFARFANLLYIDARNTGFSYGLRGDAGEVGNCSDFLHEDVLDFTRVLLRFLTDHPAIRGAPVVLVGESYGGIRAAVMAHLLLHYDDPAVAIPEDLRADLRAYFDALWGKAAGGAHTGAEIGARFVRLVLIQPLLGAEMQRQRQRLLIQQDPYLQPLLRETDRSPYDLREKRSWDVEPRARAAHADPDASRALLGFDLERLELIFPAARTNAFRTQQTDRSLEGKFQQRFGVLPWLDDYFPKVEDGCGGPLNPAVESLEPWQSLPEILRFSRLFLTNARYDMVIHTPSIPVLLDEAGFPAMVDMSPREGEARPGRIRVTLSAMDTEPAKNIEIRFPTYDDSGHMVSVTQGGDLADDVSAWLAEP